MALGSPVVVAIGRTWDMISRPHVRPFLYSSPPPSPLLHALVYVIFSMLRGGGGPPVCPFPRLSLGPAQWEHSALFASLFFQWICSGLGEKCSLILVTFGPRNNVSKSNYRYTYTVSIIPPHFSPLKAKMSLNGSLVLDLCSLVTFPGFSHVVIHIFLTKSRLRKDDPISSLTNFWHFSILCIIVIHLTNLPILRFPLTGSVNHLSESTCSGFVGCSVPDP
jgi:hypothetical protein